MDSECDNPFEESTRKAYRSHHYSPYRSVDGSTRSITIVEVMGGAFCEVRDGTKRTMIPARITGANGEEDSKFIADDKPKPLFLSSGSDGTGGDYEKFSDMDLSLGDTFIMISGRSNHSIMHSGREHGWLAEILKSDFMNNDVQWHDGREKSFETMKEMGVEVGESGEVVGKLPRVWDWVSDDQLDYAREKYGHVGPTDDEEDKVSAAQRLQESVESGDVDFIRDLNHTQRRKITWRLLRLEGYDGAFEWVESHTGSQFDREITNKNIDEEFEKFEKVA